MELMDFLQRHVYIAAVALVSGFALLAATLMKGVGGGRQVGAAAAVQLINRANALVLDVREPAEYASGHIIGSRNIPLGQLAERKKELERYRAKPIVLVCQTGVRAGRASGDLGREGFAEVSVLEGGIAAWQQAAMPLEREKERS